jgi:Flp pilus assembly protein TadD
MSKKHRQPGARRQPPPPPRKSAPVTEPEGEIETDDVLSPALKDPAVWAAAALIGLTFLVFASLRHAQFIGLDDPGYVRDNANIADGFSWRALAWAWTAGYAANWHPLTWMSHMLDIELFGLQAGGHHMVSVLLHIVNVLLLFVLMRRATGVLVASALVAALFAIHPLHVESVAWVSERKDVLSTMFWLLAMLAYVEYARQPEWRRYLLVFTLMALGLMSKPMVVTLPFALLLFDIWPLDRLRQGQTWTKLIVEKLPLVALAVAASVVTLVVQRQGGAVSDLGLLPLSTRVGNALASYGRYLGKTVWPEHLAAFYPYTNTAANPMPGWWIPTSVAVLVVFTAIAAWSFRRRPYIFVGWIWYVVTLIPVIGFVQVGTQAIADRYTYVPLIGVFIALVWWVASVAHSRPILQRAAAGLAVVVVSALAVKAHAQAAVWQTNATLWNHAITVTKANYLAENEVGVELVKAGQHAEALPHFEQASRYRPEFVQARGNLGLAYTRLGRLDEAIQNLKLAAQLQPDRAQTFNDLGFALLGKGQVDDAIANYQQAVRISPDYVDARNNLGFALAAQGRVNEAITHFQAAVRLAPNAAAGRMYLGMAYGAAGRLTEALQEFKEVQRLDPSQTYVQTEIARVEAEIKRRAGR